MENNAMREILATLTPLEKALFGELFNTATMYQSGQSESELALVAVLFGEALGEEAERHGFAPIKRAFAMHRKHSKRFPTPAHILELLPACIERQCATALPEAAGKKTLGLANLYHMAMRGDLTAKDAVKRLHAGEIEATQAVAMCERRNSDPKQCQPQAVGNEVKTMLAGMMRESQLEMR